MTAARTTVSFDQVPKLARRAAAAPVHRYRSYRSRQDHRSLAGVRLLGEFQHAHPDAFFIQVGSNDGEQHDPLRAAILRNRWRGIMIEPVPYVFDRLRANYGLLGERITLENVAIADQEGTLPFYHLAPVEDYEREGLPQWYDGIGSFKREHVLKHVNYIPDIADRLVCTEVPCLTFESLCERHDVEQVDLIHVDAEGSDAEVVRSIDLERHQPRLLLYEHYHLDAADRTECRDYLEACGYDTLEHGMDTWCLRQQHPRPSERRLLELWKAIKREGDNGRGSLRAMVAGRPAVQRRTRQAWRTIKTLVEGRRRAELEYWIDVMLGHLTPAEWRMLTEPYDDSVRLPSGADAALADHSPRLQELRARYAELDLPVTVPSVWSADRLRPQLDLRYFRGDNPYVWHYREWPRAMMLKYFILSEYVRSRDPHHLLEKLGDDGAFGCWTFQVRDGLRVSRDLLDSVNEINFLDRQLGLLSRERLRVLDIGAGYGRSAYRMIQAVPGIDDYCCVDAIPESTFISEYYLRHRECAPPARVVPLHELSDALPAGGFDLAVNIHSFSECTYKAVSWWIDLLARLRVPNLMIIPNDEGELLSFESDGTRRDFRPLLDDAGFVLSASEPVIDDNAVRELVQVTDQFFLFHRAV